MAIHSSGTHSITGFPVAVNIFLCFLHRTQLVTVYAFSETTPRKSGPFGAAGTHYFFYNML